MCVFVTAWREEKISAENLNYQLALDLYNQGGTTKLQADFISSGLQLVVSPGGYHK